MVFSNSALKQISKFSHKLDIAIRYSELDECLGELQMILNTPSSKQLMEFLTGQRESCNNRARMLIDAVKKDFLILEKSLRSESNSLGVLALLNSDSNDNTGEGFPFSRQSMLRDAYEIALRENLDKPVSGFAVLMREKAIMDYSKELILTPSVIAWEKENSKAREATELLRDIQYIKKTKSSRARGVDARRLKTAMQNICNYFIRTIEAVNTLRAFEITSITYEVGKNSKGELLKLFINNGEPVPISGVRAENVHKMLRDPWHSVEFTDDSKKNDGLRKDFDDINCAVSKKWYMYGFVHGLNDLIKSDVYSHGINRELSHLIRKRSS